MIFTSEESFTRWKDKERECKSVGEYRVYRKILYYICSLIQSIIIIAIQGADIRKLREGKWGASKCTVFLT